MLILGLGNRARHGKDTAGEAIVSYYERHNDSLYKKYGIGKRTHAKLYKFAGALYQECRELHGMTEKDPVLLQRVGMERRVEDENYWVKQIDAQLKADAATVDVAIITDVRFLNETAYVKANGGATINVSRLNLDGTPYVDPSRPADHPSETELDDYLWDYRIVAYSGEVALIEQLAICIAEFARVR